MGRKGDQAASRRGTLKKEQKGTQVFFRVFCYTLWGTCLICQKKGLWTLLITGDCLRIYLFVLEEGDWGMGPSAESGLRMILEWQQEGQGSWHFGLTGRRTSGHPFLLPQSWLCEGFRGHDPISENEARSSHSRCAQGFLQDELKDELHAWPWSPRLSAFNYVFGLFFFSVFTIKVIHAH